MILWYIDESGVTKEERDLVVGGYSIHDGDYENMMKEFKNLFLFKETIALGSWVSSVSDRLPPNQSQQ